MLSFFASRRYVGSGSKRVGRAVLACRLHPQLRTYRCDGANRRFGPKPDMRVQSTNSCGLNHSDELPPLPIDPRPSAERRGAATEIGTAVTSPNEVANIDIRRRCETSQCFPCCRDGERRVPAQPVAEPRNFGIECFLSDDRFQISDASSELADGISASSNILFTQLTPSVAQSRRRLAAERQLPKVRAIGTPNRAPEAAIRISQTFAMARPGPDREAFHHCDAGYAQAL